MLLTFMVNVELALELAQLTYPEVIVKAPPLVMLIVAEPEEPRLGIEVTPITPEPGPVMLSDPTPVRLTRH